jgi:hypothetical protein
MHPAYLPRSIPSLVRQLVGHPNLEVSTQLPKRNNSLLEYRLIKATQVKATS